MLIVKKTEKLKINEQWVKEPPPCDSRGLLKNSCESRGRCTPKTIVPSKSLSRKLKFLFMKLGTEDAVYWGAWLLGDDNRAQMAYD
jgi:hypothetical protein